MKRLVILGLTILSFACTYDNAEDLYGIKECPPDGVSFSDTVEPIINTNCAIPGCHVAGSSRQNLTLFERVQGLAPEIKSRTQSGAMPPDGRVLSQRDIDLIACWVDSGAQDN